ncbi:MAG: flagellin [Oscillospiraceae bacterium]|jgi:flagellin|nr:flagellin [Oscillospiraceae bacterium]
MRINHNIMALNASNRLHSNDNAISKNLQKLSSGYRINSAADDAAGLAVSEKMRAQINGLNQAEDNAQNGISLIQTAEGGLNETEAILQRMNTLAVESANGTYDDTNDRANLNMEVTALTTEIDRIASSTNFNGTNLLDGKSIATDGVTFQIGSDNATSQQVTLTISDMTASGLGISTVSIGTQGDAQGAIDTIKAAINSVSAARANLGAMQNRLEHTTNNLSTMSENLTSAESMIRDVDMSSEMVDLTKNQILEQAATSMLAQANAAPQSVLSLLKG